MAISSSSALLVLVKTSMLEYRILKRSFEFGSLLKSLKHSPYDESSIPVTSCEYMIVVSSDSTKASISVTWSNSLILSESYVMTESSFLFVFVGRLSPHDRWTFFFGVEGADFEGSFLLLDLDIITGLAGLSQNSL